MSKATLPPPPVETPSIPAPAETPVTTNADAPVTTALVDAPSAIVPESDIPHRFPITEPTFEQKLSEFRKQQQADEKSKTKADAVAAQIAKEIPKDAAKPAADTKPAEPAKPILTTGITAEATDAELEQHVSKHTKNLTPEQLQAFKAATFETRAQKRQIKEQEAKLAETQAKIAELESRAPQTAAEVAAVQKKLEEAQKRMEEQERELGASRIEATEQFQREIGQPLAKTAAAFKAVATEYELNEEDIIKATALKGKARAAAMAELTLDMPDYDKTKFFALVDQHTELTNKAEELRADGKKNFDAMMQRQREERDQAAALQSAERKAALPKVWEEKIVRHAPFLKPMDGDPDWNQRLEASRAYAEQADFTTEPLETQAEIMHRAAVHPLILGKLQSYEAENAKLKAHIAALKGAQPSAGNGSQGGTVAPKAEDDNDTFENRFKKFRHAQGLSA